MAKLENLVDETLNENSKVFLKNTNSDMHFKSDFLGDSLSFEWMDEMEKACPFIDIIVRNPKVALVQEEMVVKVEKAKKITVASVKDLARHTNYISKLNEKTKDVEPKKILDIRNEETYNIYENRFLYSLIYTMNKFILEKEDMLNELEVNNKKVLEYKADTTTLKEKVDISLKITSTSIPNDDTNKNIEEEIENIKQRIKRVKEYITSWQRSEMVKALDKAHITLITSQVKKTNIILKNPNFQIAVKLWDYLRNYYLNDTKNLKENFDTDGNNIIKVFLDRSFLMNYFVLDSIAASKKEQKEKLSKYAILMCAEEIDKIISLLMSLGIKIDENEFMRFISDEIKKQKKIQSSGSDAVKRKFKKEMDEYMERIKDYL